MPGDAWTPPETPSALDFEHPDHPAARKARGGPPLILERYCECSHRESGHGLHVLAGRAPGCDALDCPCTSFRPRAA